MEYCIYIVVLVLLLPPLTERQQNVKQILNKSLFFCKATSLWARSGFTCLAAG